MYKFNDIYLSVLFNLSDGKKKKDNNNNLRESTTISTLLRQGSHSSARVYNGS